MGMSNPPPPPSQSTPPQQPGGKSLADVAEGQRLVIYAILVNIATLVLRGVLGDIWILLGLIATILAVVGLLRLAGGLGYSTGIKILLIVLVFVPLIGLLMLLIVNARATEALRAGGYKVGLLGARRQQ